MSAAKTREITKRLAGALAEMSEWEDVWMEIYQRGITGIPFSAAYCPVAMYLSAQLDEEVFVTPSYASVFPVFTSEVLVDIPENVTRFILDFDTLKHLELIDPNAEVN